MPDREPVVCGFEYRTRYAANLKRKLPRIPFQPEDQPEDPPEQIKSPKAEVSFRVELMKLSRDKSGLRYNVFLTLRGIPELQKRPNRNNCESYF